MKWLWRLLGIHTPEEAFHLQMGMDPYYRDRKVKCDGLTFKRICPSQMEAKVAFLDERMIGKQLTILLSGVDRVSELHRQFIQKIRGSLQALFDHAVEEVLRIAPPDEQDFRFHVKEVSIMIGVDGGDFDGKSWSMAFCWGEGDFGYHVEFVEMEIVDVWGGD